MVWWASASSSTGARSLCTRARGHTHTHTHSVLTLPSRHRYAPPFWMAVALERADAPLLRRQRVAIKGVLAIERRQLGEQLRGVRDKLEVALVNRDTGMRIRSSAPLLCFHLDGFRRRCCVCSIALLLCCVAPLRCSFVALLHCVAPLLRCSIALLLCCVAPYVMLHEPAHTRMYAKRTLCVRIRSCVVSVDARSRPTCAADGVWQGAAFARYRRSAARRADPGQGGPRTQGVGD